MCRRECRGKGTSRARSLSLVYEATHRAKYEGGHGLERMRKVRVSVRFACETVEEIAPRSHFVQMKGNREGTHVYALTVLDLRARILSSRPRRGMES